MSKEKITPCLWFNGKAKEAAEFYCAHLQNAHKVAESPLVIDIEVDGNRISCLEGGPYFTPNASISLTCVCSTTEEIDRIWNAFIDGGNVLMDIGTYPWSARYGWLNDRYGISWQFIVGDISESAQRITPSLLFTKEQYGRAEEAINYYTSLFPESHIKGIFRYTKEESPEEEGKIAHSEISLAGCTLMLLESAQSQTFTFNEGVSLMIHCADQAEIDYYWDNLTSDGRESMCGWLTDKFGVSWQVIPAVLSDIMQDPAKAPKAASAFMQMRKFEIDKLMQAIENI